MIHPSTFSIVACDLEASAWGVAVASKFLAVGSVVPWVRAGAGAVATQSYANTSFGPRGLDAMEHGLSAEEALERVLADDPQRDLRQAGMVDAQGRAATFTGVSCFAWAGGLTGKGFAVQGNILAGPQVVQAMADAFTDASGSLPWRLHAALLAGDRAGGDRRGRQSAAIYVAKPQGGYSGFNDRWIDYRVDDHADPIVRLGELLHLHDLYFGESNLEEKASLSGDALRRLQIIMARLGYYSGPIHSEFDAATRAALEGFLGNENFEERVDLDAGLIDQPVLDYLFQHFKEAES